MRFYPTYRDLAFSDLDPKTFYNHVEIGSLIVGCLYAFCLDPEIWIFFSLFFFDPVSERTISAVCSLYYYPYYMLRFECMLYNFTIYFL